MLKHFILIAALLYTKGFGNDDGTRLAPREMRTMGSQAMAAVDYNNFYQDAFDAFVSPTPLTEEMRDRLLDDYGRTLVNTEGNNEQLKQKTFFLALLKESPVNYRITCEGCSYSESAVAERAQLRNAVDFKGIAGEKTNFFKQLLAIDKAQDESKDNHTLTQTISGTAGAVNGTYQPLLQAWINAIRDEKDYKQLVRKELTTATAANLTTKPYNRVVPFVKFLAIPLWFCFMEWIMLDTSSAIKVTWQQNYTMPLDGIVDFMQEHPVDIFKAPDCIDITNCTLSLYRVHEASSTSAYRIYVAPVMAILFSVFVYGQEILHELLYIANKICYKRNIERTNDEIVTLVFNATKNMPDAEAKTVVTRVKEFLPGLLKKRTWGFKKELMERIQQIKKNA